MRQASVRRAVLAAAAVMLPAGSRCDDARVASRNLSKAADSFEIDRRIVFHHGITGSHMLAIEGRCAIEDQTTRLEVTCRTGPDPFHKHFLGLSDNVTYFAERLARADVSVFHHRVTFKPRSVLPDADFRGDAGALTENGSG